MVPITTSTSEQRTTPGTTLAPVRWGPLLGVAGVLAAVLLAVSGRHGYHLDELYSRVAGRNLDWGHVDQPPLAALVARVEVSLLGDTLTAFRLVPALLVGAAVVLAGLIARELGGGERAQVLAAVVGAVSGLAAHTGHILGTNNFDVLAWVAVCWLAIRMARTGNTRLWPAIGAVVGVALTAKDLIALLLLSLAVGVLISGPRRLLWNRHLLAGAGLAALIASPVLIWQAVNGWPQLEMAAALSKALEGLARPTFLPIQFLLIGLFLSPVWITGVVALLRRAQWRPYRFVAVAYLFMVVFLFAIGGQATYTTALQFVLLAAGSVVVEQWARGAVRKSLVGAMLTASAVSSAVLVLPVLPIQTYASNPVLQELAIVQFDQAGWPEFTAQVAEVYRSLPAADQERAVLYGNHYGQAGALDKYGPEHGLPRAYSGHNSYADFGVPGDDKTVVIAIGVDERFSALFARCEPRGAFRTDLPLSDRGQEFTVCHDPVKPWAQIWSELRWIGFQCPYTAKAVTATSEVGCV